MTRRSFPNPTPRGEWLPTVARERTASSRCCAKCRRGVPGYGELPCGFPNGCPNTNCAHHTKTPQIAAERPASHNLDQLLAELDEHDNPKENL